MILFFSSSNYQLPLLLDQFFLPGFSINDRFKMINTCRKNVKIRNAVIVQPCTELFLLHENQSASHVVKINLNKLVPTECNIHVNARSEWIAQNFQFVIIGSADHCYSGILVRTKYIH